MDPVETGSFTQDHVKFDLVNLFGFGLQSYE